MNNACNEAISAMVLGCLLLMALRHAFMRVELLYSFEKALV